MRIAATRDFPCQATIGRATIHPANSIHTRVCASLMARSATARALQPRPKNGPAFISNSRTSSGSMYSKSSGMSRQITRLSLRCFWNLFASLLRCVCSITKMTSAHSITSDEWAFRRLDQFQPRSPRSPDGSKRPVPQWDFEACSVSTRTTLASCQCRRLHQVDEIPARILEEHRDHRAHLHRFATKADTPRLQPLKFIMDVAAHESGCWNSRAE